MREWVASPLHCPPSLTHTQVERHRRLGTIVNFSATVWVWADILQKSTLINVIIYILFVIDKYEKTGYIVWSVHTAFKEGEKEEGIARERQRHAEMS